MSEDTMTPRKIPPTEPAPAGPIRHLSRADIGRLWGYQPVTVARWLERYPADSDHPFPLPDVVVGMDAGGRPVDGWLPGREEEIREWERTRPGQGSGGGRPAGSRLGSHVLE